MNKLSVGDKVTCVYGFNGVIIDSRTKVKKSLNIKAIQFQVEFNCIANPYGKNKWWLYENEIMLKEKPINPAKIPFTKIVKLISKIFSKT